MPVIIKPYAIEDTALQQFQTFNDPSKLLCAKNGNDQDIVLTDLLRYMVTLGRNIELDE